MNICVVGAGFSGLSVAYYLLQRGACVTLFEKEEIGKNTSSSASGLLHPFPGFAARTSMFEKEARLKSLELLEAASSFSDEPIYSKEPLLRVMLDSLQEARFEALSIERQDVRLALSVPPHIKEGAKAYWIDSGITVYSRNYILALHALVTSLGAVTVGSHIHNLDELSSFDHIVLALGYESAHVLGDMGFQAIKGQALVAKLEIDSMSILGKGYLAKTERCGIYHLGSTYEHHFASSLPSEDVAKNLIMQSAKAYLRGVDDFEILSAKAGVRLAKRSSYLPFVARICPRVSTITAMGSRGLLYHAFCGDLLAKSLLTHNESIIPKELRLV